MSSGLGALVRGWPGLSAPELFVICCHLYLWDREGAQLQEDNVIHFEPESGLSCRLLPAMFMQRLASEQRDPTIAISRFRFPGSSDILLFTWTTVGENTVLINRVPESSTEDARAGRSVTYTCHEMFTQGLNADSQISLTDAFQEISRVLDLLPSRASAHDRGGGSRGFTRAEIPNIRPGNPSNPGVRHNGYQGDLIGPHHPIFTGGPGAPGAARPPEPDFGFPDISGLPNPAGAPRPLGGPRARVDPIWPDDPLGRRPEFDHGDPSGGFGGGGLGGRWLG